MKNLVGLEEFKKEMGKVVRYMNNSNYVDSSLQPREIFPYHYIITTEGQGGNGRFVRNVIERLKMKQSKRLLGQREVNSRKLQRITAGDVKALLADPDLVSTGESRKSIGF